MQLKPGQLQKILASATCGLLSATAQIENAQAKDDKWNVNGSGFFYTENERISVYEETLYVKKEINDNEFVSLKRTHDILTGASPTGEAKPSASQTFTTPSGSSITNKSGKSPLGKFEDIRSAFNATWQKPMSRFLTSVLSANYSYEYDYTSAGAGAQFSKDLANKQTTLNMGLSANYDIVRPTGGVPTVLAATTDPARYESDQKFMYDALLGVTQVKDKNTLVTGTIMWGSSYGYLTDPYKIISRLNLDGSPSGSSQFEKRPESRSYKSAHIRIIKNREDKKRAGDVVDVSYRLYYDDWGIFSNTVDTRYRHDLESKEARKNQEYVQWHLRLYYQTASDFYAYGLPVQNVDPAYASADYRLANLGTVTLGGLWGRELIKNLDLTVRGEYLFQWYMQTHLSPLHAILTQASLYYHF